MTDQCPGERAVYWRDQCGVFAVYGRGIDAARATFFGLFALQHRGQESAGIAVGDSRGVIVDKDMGLVNQVFNEERLGRLKGHIAIGHVRYSTTGRTSFVNAQPMVTESPHGTLALAHNGNLVNPKGLQRKLNDEGVSFHSTSDSEIILGSIAHSPGSTVEESVANAMKRLKGVYSAVLLAKDKAIAFRDPSGVRPLCLGQFNDIGWVVASETCALDVIGARFIREVQPGEIVVLDENGLREIQAIAPRRPAVCVFEFIYFARPDSYIYGKSLYECRRRMGHMLAQEHPVEADMVIPIPETGIPAAIGFAEVSKIPFGEGFIKNRYIHRTFIQPDQRMLEMGVTMKLTPLRDAIRGKRLVVVDDSIVRGTTTAPEVRLLRDSGAKEVHVRISSPPVRWPCFYGIDTSAGRSELIAARMSVESIRKHLGADSLGYLSSDGVARAIGIPKNKFCFACFNGRYPIEVPKYLSKPKFELEEAP